MVMKKKLIGLPSIEEEILEAIEREERKIKVRLERVKGRKVMTIIEGIDDEKEGERITKILKKKFACGGTYKEGKVMLQGDHRRRVKEELVKMGYPEGKIEVIF